MDLLDQVVMDVLARDDNDLPEGAGVVPVYGPNSIKGVAWAFQTEYELSYRVRGR